MTKKDEQLAMKAIALCFKPFLKPEEAQIYCNLGRTQLAKKCEEFGVYKNYNGYFEKADLDRMLSGKKAPIKEMAAPLGAAKTNAFKSKL